MKVTGFFRLPIISFIICFCLLFLALVIKLNELNQHALILNYHYSPDFMRILGSSLYMMLIFAICLHKIKLYVVNIGNIIFVLITVTLALLLTYWLDIYLTDLFTAALDLRQAAEYKIYLFWYPIISRIVTMFIIYLVVAMMTYFVKSKLNWIDEESKVDLTASDVIHKINIIYFVLLYLAVNFIFQRYLYIGVYIYSGGSDLPEFQNFSFYLASIMTSILLLMWIKQKGYQAVFTSVKTAIKMACWLLLSQLLISIVISFITIYAIQYYFVWTQPADKLNIYAHYISLLYAMLNSIFIVSVLTCLASYFAGRFWLKKSLVLS